MQKIPVNNFEWIEDTFQFNEDFIINSNEESEEGFFVEYDVQHLEKLHELHNDLPFLHKRIKNEKVEKLVATLHDKTDYVILIRNLNHGLVLIKTHRIIKFNENAWLKPYMDMNTDLRKKAKMSLQNIF